LHFSKTRGRRRAYRSVRTLALALVLGTAFGATVAAQQEAEPEAPTPRTVTLVADGETRTVETQAKTVGEMLAEVKAYPGSEDRCSLPLTTPLADETRVVITRVQTKKRVERIPIPFKTKERFTSSLRAGVTKVAQEGKKGERAKTFLEVYKDGKLVQRRKIAEAVTAPRTAVVLKGSRGLLASRGYFSGRRVVEMVATGYGPGRASNGRWAGQTATGLRPGYGVVAVDPRFIPLGTRLYIEGYGYAVAGDTGGAIKGNRIDLGHDTHREAMRVGRKRVKVLILN
jgi:3D (Asp-Asp-Asp) domain-containing protein